MGIKLPEVHSISGSTSGGLMGGLVGGIGLGGIGVSSLQDVSKKLKTMTMLAMAWRGLDLPVILALPSFPRQVAGRHYACQLAEAFSCTGSFSRSGPMQ